jgi:hypothetical protein
LERLVEIKTENKDDENKIIIFSIQNKYFGKLKYSSAKSWIKVEKID